MLGTEREENSDERGRPTAAVSLAAKATPPRCRREQMAHDTDPSARNRHTTLSRTAESVEERMERVAVNGAHGHGAHRLRAVHLGSRHLELQSEIVRYGVFAVKAAGRWCDRQRGRVL